MSSELDPAAGLLSDLSSTSPVTVVAFGGLTTEGEEPVFEFFRFLGDLDVKKVFLRDHEQAWYQRGVRGVADTSDGVEEALRELLGEDGCRQAVFTGGSAGGYAALLYGSRLSVAEVHAFAPQTFVSRLLRKRYKDFRWQKQINRMWDEAPRSACFDIKAPVRRANRGGRAVPLHLHVGGERRDQAHVQRIRTVPGVELHAYDYPDHAVARYLNETGQLPAVFDGAIERASKRR